MFGRQYATAVGLVLLAAACGGEVGDGAGAGGAASPTGGSGGSSAGSGARPGGFGGAPKGFGGAAGGRAGVGGAFVDPGCPDIPPPPPIVECDPLEQVSSCPEGDGCYPYVDHPFGDACGTEVFGAICRYAGFGQHGDLCGEGTTGCAAGHVCVLGARAGKRCARLCLVGEPNSCPDGLLCEDTDIQGYGVCS